MKKLCIKLIKILWVAVAIAIILYAILFGILRAATPFLETYQQQIISEVNKVIPYQVTIADLSISWYHFSPVIEVDNIKITQADAKTQPFLIVNQAYIGVDFIKLIKNHQVVPNKIIGKGVFLILPSSVLDKLKPQSSQNNFNLQQYQSYLKQASMIDEIILKNVNVKLAEKNKIRPFISGDILVERSGANYKAQGSIAAASNRATIDFAMELKPDSHDLTNSTLQSYLEVSDLNLANLKKHYPIKSPGLANIENAKIWFRYQNKQINYGAIEAELANVQFKTAQVSTKKDIPYVSINAIYHKKDNKQQLAINQLAFSEEENGSSALIQLDQAEQKTKLEVYAQKFKVNTKIILDYISINNKEYQQKLKALSPLFTVIKTRDSITIKNKKLQSYKVSGELALASVQSNKKSPGVTNANISFSANKDKGTAALELNDSVVTMPWLFRAPVNMTNASSLVTWKRVGARWVLSVDDTHLVLPQGDIIPTMKLFIGGEQPTRLEVMANADIKGLSQKQIYNYLPVAIIPEPVIAWLDTSLLNIGKGHAQLILRGQISDFPFDKQNGVFLITGQVANSRLHYYDHWPIVSKLFADLMFNNRSMLINIKSGDTAGIVIGNTKVEIPYMGGDKPVTLTVKGKGAGTVHAGINYLQHSPLGAGAAELSEIKSQGNFDLDLDLTVPIANQPNTIALAKGRAKIHNASLQYQGNPLSLNKVNGTINFANDDISSDKITGLLGDKPVVLSVEPVKAGDKITATQVNLTARFSMTDLDHYFPGAIPEYITGASSFTASMILDKTKGSTIALASDLKGVAIDLPTPLGKQSKKISAFNLLLHDVNPNLKQLVLDYQNTLSANIYLSQQKNKKYQVSKGMVSVGGANNTMPNKGLNLSVKLPSIDVSPWMAWYKKNSGSSKSTHIMLNSAQVSIDEFTVARQTLHNLIVTYKPYSTQSLFTIASNEVTGKINLPKTVNSATPIQADFSKLYLKTTKGNTSNSQFAPNQYYNIDFSCNDCRINKSKLGTVKATVRNNNNALNIRPLNLNNAYYNFSGAASWTRASNKTEVSGRLFSGNTSKMLAGFAVPANIMSNNATVNLALNWSGAPYSFNMASLNGTATVDVKEGTIEGLDKNTSTLVGLGNVLTALNLESLPGRLSQGFGSKNKGTGFYFKKLYGQFNIKNGNLWTQSTYLDGTVAYISMKGRIGLQAKDYNLIMAVIPHLTSSLPVIATIAGGPIIGAATWVVDKAVSPAVDKITQYNYAITGTWKNPQIKKEQGKTN